MHCFSLYGKPILVPFGRNKLNALLNCVYIQVAIYFIQAASISFHGRIINYIVSNQSTPRQSALKSLLINKLNLNQILPMLEDNPFAPRAVTCLIHRKQKATHICTDISCQQNPVLCAFCLNDSRWRSLHPHESLIKPLSEGIEWLTSIIRSQAKSIELVYQRTIGGREFDSIKSNLQKGSILSEQLDNRLDTLRLQVEMEMQILIKQFQKQVQLQKQQFMKRLDQYRRNFANNLDIVKRQCIDILSYQHSLKYYNNTNNFTLKLINQTERRSHLWLINQKKVLLKVSQTLENPSFSANLSLTLNRINKTNGLAIPVWKGERNETEIDKQCQMCIKSIVSNWIDLPEPVEDVLKLGEYSNSNKFIAYTPPI